MAYKTKTINGKKYFYSTKYKKWVLSKYQTTPSKTRTDKNKNPQNYKRVITQNKGGGTSVRFVKKSKMARAAVRKVNPKKKTVKQKKPFKKGSTVRHDKVIQVMTNKPFAEKIAKKTNNSYILKRLTGYGGYGYIVMQKRLAKVVDSGVLNKTTYWVKTNLGITHIQR